MDEIPNLNNTNFVEKLNIFEQDMFYYKFNLKQPNLKWLGSRAFVKKYLISPQWIRNIKDKSYPLWRFDVLFSKNKYFKVNISKKWRMAFFKCKNTRGYNS